MNKQDVLNKIKKCLALAKSNNANEAATALRQAQKLMEKYSVTSAEIDLSEFETCKASTHVATKKPAYQHGLVTVICKAFGVHAVFHYRHVEFIGLGIQPEIASYAYQVLFRQLKADRNDYLQGLSNRFKKTNKTRKADLFAEGWVYEIRKKVTEFVNPSKFDKLIEEFKESYFDQLQQPKVKRHKAKANDDDAIYKGRLAGKNAQLHHGMDGQSQLRIAE